MKAASSKYRHAQARLSRPRKASTAESGRLIHIALPSGRISMKLYFSPGACSLSPHIVFREAGLPVEIIRIDNKAKKSESVDDFLAVNPIGMVPVLALANGETLTEGPAIVQYLADMKPESGLMPKT